jgi:hypothetical protein
MRIELEQAVIYLDIGIDELSEYQLHIDLVLQNLD